MNPPPGVLGWTTASNGVHFHRITEPIRVLKDDHGQNALHSDRLDDDVLSTVDTVVSSMLHTEQQTQAWHALAAAGSHRLVLDLDDWMWNPDWHVFSKAYTPENLARLYSNVERAHVVTTPSPLIASYLTRFNDNVWVVPNTVPAYTLSMVRQHDTKMRWVGYQGSPSHERDWGTVAVSVGKFLRDHPSWGVGFIGLDPGDLTRFPSFHLRWTGDRHNYYRAVAIFDVGIGPLRNSMFNAAKSSLRAIEYAALGVVPVLPDMDPYRAVIKTGVNGVLIRSHETHRGVLTDLAADPDHLARMSAQARIDAQQWTTEANIGNWVEAWGSGQVAAEETAA